jgi:hypothetical protein
VIRALAAGLFVLLVPAASGAPVQTVEPIVVVRSFVASVRTPNATTEVTWRSPEHVAVRSSDSDFRSFVQRGRTLYEGAVGPPNPSAGAVTRRTYAAQPDADSLAEELLGNQVDFVLAEARAGKLRLYPTSGDAPPDWTANVLLRANDCAGLRAAPATVIIDRPTLLPLGVRSHRGITTVNYRRINAPLAAGAFRLPDVGRVYRRDQGFVRASPARAAGPLPYAPELPASVPNGFKRVVSGWAQRSGRTGPEASNPRYASLFGAVYRRGWERIDVTQRLAGATGWVSDPFGVECGFQLESAVRVKGVPAAYGAGPEITPHVYWRRGKLLYTVSGPFPKKDLVAIAESLAPVR